MAFLDAVVELQLKGKISDDLSQLGRLYKAKASKYHFRSVDHSLVEGLLHDGWEEYGQPLQTRTRLRRKKTHDVQFEDDMWCQLYDLGFRCFSVDRDFKLPFGKSPDDKKQIDVLAVNEDSILLVECKSAKKWERSPSFKTEFEALRQRMDGHKKALEQIFGIGRKIRYIFATRNYRISRDGADAKRLVAAGGFLYNDNTYEYVASLLTTYKNAAHYQFMAMLFKGQDINRNRIEVPAIEGQMGARKEKYYMFSLEPGLLLKLGFVLHRTRANEAEMPTYQRLLVPARLKGIGKFIDEGGFFPNSVILNFSESIRKIEFQPHSRGGDTRSRTGILKIPNSYAIAYIIDGQHRIYGYANSPHKLTNTIPVVAFLGLDSSEQLEMFMDINQNQKAVSPTLRITLEEDLYWNAPRLDSRIKALRSAVIRQLGGDQSGPLFGKIALGEDKAELTAKPFADALLRCGLLPVAKGNRFIATGKNCSLYDIASHDHASEMRAACSRIVRFLNLCYELAEEFFDDDDPTLKRFIVYNRGTYAFINLIGSLNTFLTERGDLSLNSSNAERIGSISKYLHALFEALKNISLEDRALLLGKLGTGAENTWFRIFQDFVNKRFNDYNPEDLNDWRERQNKELQDEGRSLGIQIERYLKLVCISNLKAVFGENWDIEIGSIKRACEKRAGEEEEKSYKEGLGRKNIPWTDMLLVSDYRSIIEKYWAKTPVPKLNEFRAFEEIFALDIGQGFNSKAEKLRWLSFFGSYRNTWAHEGTKEKGLNRKEVEFIRDIHSRLLP
ncbi:DGQHR domain-containing protein [Sneathiella sp.]|uniref:DGQHR domain-containing protein n=1 Tax=Sneathiella sp. TaxID=1964365 RepID=UPI002621CFBC|nr:DGQHR domain-containing protein [Sneathiella sp.]MDF2369088.1 DGQHR domain-containing protein [Sneathiella sp.]